MDWRSPTYESSAPSSAVSDLQSRPVQSRLNSFSSPYQRQQQLKASRRPGSMTSMSGSVFSNYDESAAGSLASEYASRGSKRGSQDQSVFAEPDSTNEMEETGAMRQLHLEDRAPLSLDPALQQYSYSPVVSSDSRLGMKRRASSPPPDPSHEDKAPLHSAGSSNDLYQRNTAAAAAAAHHPTNRASPVSRFGPPHGSISSASSAGLRNGSYASSGGLSVGSSLTSLSSNHERLSPSSEHQYTPQHSTQQFERDSQYVTSPSVNPSPRSSLSQSHPLTPSESRSSAAAAARKMSNDTPTPRKPSNPPNLQAPMHICSCCPKKPKRFETAEELR